MTNSKFNDLEIVHSNMVHLIGTRELLCVRLCLSDTTWDIQPSMRNTELQQAAGLLVGQGSNEKRHTHRVGTAWTSHHVFRKLTFLHHILNLWFWFAPILFSQQELIVVCSCVGFAFVLAVFELVGGPVELVHRFCKSEHGRRLIGSCVLGFLPLSHASRVGLGGA